MLYDKQLIQGILLQRYKRFLADIRLEDGSVITAHSGNTGSMLGCCTPGSTVYCSVSDNPGRKYPHSWELTTDDLGCLVGINTGLSNRLVREAIEDRLVQSLSGYAKIRSEVPYGEESSRVDLLLTGHPDKPDCYIEVKNATLVNGRTAMFPDAVSKRGTRHLRELLRMVKEGYRAVIFFCIQREGIDVFRPAMEIDPEYTSTLRDVASQGVEVMAYASSVSPRGIKLCNEVVISLE